ncbi:MAG: DUF47 family protein [Thermodesulfobacteriota bacterium]
MAQIIKSLFKFLPREEKFFDMFEAQAMNILDAAKELRDLMDGFQEIEDKTRLLKDLEHKGDTITHDIIRKVNKTFVTPIDREDIHALASTLDDILDTIEASAARIYLYRITEPTELAVRFADIILRSVEEVVKTIACLRNFEDIFSHCVELNRLENEADQVLREAYQELFADPTDPLWVIKWKDVYETLEASTDRCEDVANILEGIVLKHT